MAQVAGTGDLSMSQRSYEVLRDRLIMLDIAPGDPINEAGLAAELGVGRTPVREALKRLETDHLVVAYPRRGTFATPVDIADLAAISELRAVLERKNRLRFETDLEALLEADGVVHRPGPREHLDADIIGALREAILGGCWVELDLQAGASGRISWRNRVGPIAFLLGEGRQYLVGFSDYRQQVQLFRLANLRKVKLLPETYQRPEGFDLSHWLAQSFGTWRDAPQQVEWRFAPHVAAEVRQFRFHPDQSLTDNADGSVTVRFTASGLDEMCWHLFRWGDAVQVVAPAALRDRYREMLDAADGALDAPASG